MTQSPYTDKHSSFAGNNSFDNDSLDIKRYLSLFLTNWYWFAITLFITVSIAYGINRWSGDVYTVSSTLLIKDDKLEGLGPGMTNIFPGLDGYKSQQNLKNEIGILKSFSLNYEVMQGLPEFHVEYISVGKRGIVESRVYKRSPFVVVYDSLGEQTFGKRIEISLLSDNEFRIQFEGDKDFQRELRYGDRFSERGFDFVINPRIGNRVQFDPAKSNKYFFYFVNPAALANRYRRKLSITPIEEEASLVTLSTTGFVPEQEADYLNRLMDVYIESGLTFKNKTATQTMDFIEEQLLIISDSLHIAEGDLEDFRFVNNLIDISTEGVVIQNKLEQIDRERTALLMQRNYYEYLQDYLDSKSETEEIVAPSVVGISDPLIINMVGELSAYKQQKKQLGMNLSDSAEPLKIIDANIVMTSKAIRENIRNGIQTIENILSDANERLTAIEKEIRKLPSTEREMINIQRKFDINNTVYTFLLEKRAEAGIVRAANVPDNRVIDEAGAYTFSRIKPKERQNLMIALVLGLLFPVIALTLIDLLNNKIIDKKDIEKATNAPVIGFIGHNTLKTEMPVIEQPGSTLSESFRSVRTNLKYFLKDIPNPVIAVSSTITAEGKTFVSANLAGILALLGKRVLLIGLDLRKPRTHKIFGIENINGISKFLVGESKFEEVLIKTEIDNLWYAPSGPVPPNPAELIDSQDMKDFITQAKKLFDYVVIDTPPVAIVTDALLLSSVADFYIFVVRQRYSSKNTLGLIEELYCNENIKRIGVLMNDISLTGYYGYGVRYGYLAGYGYSYGYNYYGDYVNSRYGYHDSGKGYYPDEK